MVVTRMVNISICVLTINLICLCLYIYLEVNYKTIIKLHAENSHTSYQGVLQCDGILRPTKLDVRQDIWQVARVNTSENLVYSLHAYYDNRTSFQGR